MKPRHHLNLNRQISQTLASHIIHIVLTIRLFSHLLSLLGTFDRLRDSSLFYSAPWQIKRPPQLMALMALVLHQSSMFPLLHALTCCLPTIKGEQNALLPTHVICPLGMPSMDNESNSQPPRLSNFSSIPIFSKATSCSY